MDAALNAISRFIDGDAVSVIRKWFCRIQGMPGGERIFRRIASTSNREEVEDYLAEIVYSLVFTGLRFQVEIEPLGSKGPDLKVSRDGHTAYVEIMRFREVHPGPPILDPADDNLELSDYGDPRRDTRKAYDKILAKFDQVGNDTSIIAIWNDDGDLEDTAVYMAVNVLLRDTARGVLSLPRGLLFILYGSPWVRGGNGKQLCCFTIHDCKQPYQSVWQQELASSTVRELLRRALAR